MAKKKKNQTQEGPVAPVNEKDTVFPEAGAAQGAAGAGETNQISAEVAELITATIKVLIAQRKVFGLSTTLTSLTRAVAKALEPYVNGISKDALRDFIRSEVQKMGYPIVVARVSYTGVPYEAETVILYRNFDEVVDAIRSGRNDSLKVAITAEGIDTKYDKPATV
jgi:hypothetical protein